jgi:hypothetical protein
MREIKRLLLWTMGILLFGVVPVCAEYTLVLKNGRRITVESYREEGGMIKFKGFGGEIGINRDQIEKILRGEGEGSRGMVIGEERAPPSEPPSVGETATEKGERPAGTPETPQSSEEKLAEERAKEEKEYQERVKALTEQIKTLRDRYALATRGTTGPEPSAPTSEEELKARQDDLVSRLRDAQQAAAGSAAAPSVKTPLPGYTGKQKELSDMRNRLYQLEKERDKLIGEMKQKNFDTGSLFLE